MGRGGGTTDGTVPHKDDMGDQLSELNITNLVS